MPELPDHVSRKHREMSLKDDYASQTKRYIAEALDGALNDGHSLYQLNAYIHGCLSDPMFASRALSYFDTIHRRSAAFPFPRARRIANLASSKLSQKEKTTLINWYMSHVAVEMAKRNVLAGDGVRLVPAATYS